MDYDVIIIGAGPSGLTAALYNARARLKTLVIESSSVPAQAIITDCIENYPGFPDGINGFKLVENFKKQTEKFGAEFIAGDVQRIEPYKEGSFSGWKVVSGDRSFSSLSLVIASGASPKRLGVPGEDRLHGKGVSYCATCDGPLYKDKDIVVIGGGDAAVEESLFLTRFVKRLTLIHRRNSLRAAKVLQERVFADKKIEIVWDSELIEILGEDKIRSVRVKDIKTGKKRDFLCEGVFLFVGYMPNTDFIKDVVKVDSNGYIITDDTMKTSEEGIFACGDCRKKLLRQVVTACGDGATSAFSAQRYVEEKTIL